MLNCNPAPAPGNNTLKTTSEMEQELNKEEHAAYRRMVGKLQWMTYTRPDIGFATKELARALTQPTTADQQKFQHLLRYIKGTQRYKQYVRPTTKTPTAEAVPDIQVFVDSDWAGCATTRKSTTGFQIKVFGATIHYGSRTQAKNCAEQRGSRTLCDQHRSNRSTPHQQFPEGNSQHEEDQHPHTYRLIKRKEHGNKNRSIKESQTYRAQAPFHTTIGRTRPCEDCQDQHDQQPG